MDCALDLCVECYPSLKHAPLEADEGVHAADHVMVKVQGLVDHPIDDINGRLDRLDCTRDRTATPAANLPQLPDPDIEASAAPHCDEASDQADEKMVSVISPTISSRAPYHEKLYTSFDKQTYQNKELIILDTGPEPSPFFSACTDPRVRYVHYPGPENSISIGEKRNTVRPGLTGFSDIAASLCCLFGSHILLLSVWLSPDFLALLSVWLSRWCLREAIWRMERF